MIRHSLLCSLALLLACEGPASTAGNEGSAHPVSQSAAQDSGADGAPRPSASSSTQAREALPKGALPIEDARFAQLFDELSEPENDFFSDNFISNETSLLQIASALPKEAPKDGVYLGVGPEQNFTYVALSRPVRAYIVDIRRDNALLHLLYKAVFERATSRSHFVALLIGRDHESAGAPAASASLAEVLAHAEKAPAEAKAFERIHDDVMTTIAGHGIKLGARDKKSMGEAHRAFFKGGLDLRFKLREESHRKYPSLRELLELTDPEDKGQKTFLASEESFRLVQRMQRENRIIPMVGDFAGKKAMPALAKHLHAEGLTVSAFYVSNVEQYLLADGLWGQWQKNVAALPINDESVFIRAYLDQGKRHPLQMQGHRTTTTLQRIAKFNARKRPYPSMLAVASDEPLAAK
jgi:hypothetical protein